MKLFVGNLSFQTTEGAIQDLFAQYGNVTDTHLVMDRMTNRPRGFAFVTFSTADEAQKAMDALNGQEFDGRNISVTEARPREERPQRDFRGGGGGGGGGGRGGDRGGDRGDRGGDRKGGFRPRR